MAKNSSLYTDGGPRRELATVIKDHISPGRLQEALEVKKERQRLDMLGHIIFDAIKNSPIVSFSGIPHVYSKSNGIYLPFDYHEFKTAVDAALRRSNVPDGNYSRLAKMVADAWSEVMCRKFLIDTSVVVMNNGVFDTMDMQLHNWSDQYMTNMKVDYDYNPDEYPTQWRKFLSEVLPDTEMQNLLQEFIAATYVDRRFVKIENALVLLGSGSNGKSVVFEVISALLGKNNVSNFSIRDLISSPHASQNLASCNGLRLNYCSEMRTSVIDEGNADAFKSIVSGESQMARSLYKEPFRACNIPLIMANANKIPSLKDSSYSLLRRLIVIPFDKFISDGEQNKELATEIIKELPGVFNWAIEGLVRLRRNNYKFVIPERCQNLVKQCAIDNNGIMRWVTDKRMSPRFNNKAGQRMVTSLTNALYIDYKTWTINDGEPPLTRNRFYDNMELMGFKRTRNALGQVFCYYVSPSEQEILEMNMDIAIGMQRVEYIESMKKATESMKDVRVVGMDALEKYLGIEDSGILWAYMSNGALEDTYQRVGDDYSFDVLAVQHALAKYGFYEDYVNGNGNCKKKSGDFVVGSMRREFNYKMKAMKIPIRKHSCKSHTLPIAYANCWIVPDSWQYSRRAAAELMKTPCEIYNKRITEEQNGE